MKQQDVRVTMLLLAKAMFGNEIQHVNVEIFEPMIASFVINVKDIRVVVIARAGVVNNDNELITISIKEKDRDREVEIGTYSRVKLLDRLHRL